MIAFPCQITKRPRPRRKSSAKPKRVSKAQQRTLKGLARFTALAQAKALVRGAALSELRALVAGGMGKCEALDLVSKEFNFTFTTSSRSLRRWEVQAMKFGARGLYHKKHNRVGRKPKYQSVTE